MIGRILSTIDEGRAKENGSVWALCSAPRCLKKNTVDFRDLSSVQSSSTLFLTLMGCHSLAWQVVKPGMSAEGNSDFRPSIYPMPVRLTVSGRGNVGRRPCNLISLLVNMCRSCTSEENIADPWYRLRNARQFETRRQGKRRRCHAELWHTADHFMNSRHRRKYEPMHTVKMASVCIASSQLPIRLT